MKLKRGRKAWRILDKEAAEERAQSLGRPAETPVCPVPRLRFTLQVLGGTQSCRHLVIGRLT